MCAVLHDKIQCFFHIQAEELEIWKKQQQQQRNEAWQNETTKTDQFQRQSKKQTIKTNKGREIFSFKVDVEVFRYQVKVSGHRSGNV